MTALANLTFRETFVAPISHPLTGEPLETDDGKPMTVTLYSSDTKQYRQAAAAVSAESEGMDGVEIAARIIAGCVKEWTVQVDPDGSMAPVEDALSVILAHPWLRRQLDVAIHDRANFFAGASKD